MLDKNLACAHDAGARTEVIDAEDHIDAILHLESLNDQVRDFSGVRVRETLPDWIVQQADEVAMVDLPPEALLNRLKRGAVYSPEKARKALHSFFKESTLVALRELALRQAAHEVDVRQDAQKDVEVHLPVRGTQEAAPVSSPLETPDRILIHVTADPATAALIRRGRRVADFLRAKCFAVFVGRDSALRNLATTQREAIEKHLNFARNLRIETRLLQGKDVARILVDFAHLNGITQIFILRPSQGPWSKIFGRDVLRQVVRLASDIQVSIVAERRPT